MPVIVPTIHHCVPSDWMVTPVTSVVSVPGLGPWSTTFLPTPSTFATAQLSLVPLTFGLTRLMM